MNQMWLFVNVLYIAVWLAAEFLNSTWVHYFLHFISRGKVGRASYFNTRNTPLVASLVEGAETDGRGRCLTMIETVYIADSYTALVNLLLTGTFI